MMERTNWLRAATALVASALPLAMSPASGACTLTIQATSDTLFNGTTYNVGQKAILTAQGPAAQSYAWTIGGPVNIKDYEEDLGTRLTTLPAAPLPWNEIALTGADMQSSSISFYWKPAANQIHPSNVAGTRTVTLNYNDGTGPCTVSATFTVERNVTNTSRQPEDFYTSNHRAVGTTNVEQGNVIDEHMYWHWPSVPGSHPASHWTQFLAWHGYFLARFDQWRQAFGYPPVAPWYPGRPLPTGPEFDHSPRLSGPFDTLFNRIPLEFTLAGTPDPTNMPTYSPKLADFGTLAAFEGALEGGYHGQVHCEIGPGGFGGMCDYSSPKDPLFWRWHGFIDRLYRNYCGLKGLTNCHVPAPVGADPWMGDNQVDINNGGVPPSPGPHWMSPDIWNRRSEDVSDACMPRTSPPDLNTVGGVTRNCDKNHENPVTGDTNYLYATLRNTGATPQRNVYAEVAVYIADASTGLSWPADFDMLPESRQFIALNLEPGQVTDIGPLPWVVPSNAMSDHWCIYIRVLSVQEAPLVEGTNVDTNVGNSNSIAWRNLKIVNPGQFRMSSRFVVRNIRREDEELQLTFDAAPALMQRGQIVLQLDPALQRAMVQARMPDGVRALGKGRYLLTGLRTRIEGLRLPPRGQGVAEIRLEGAVGDATGDIVVTQSSRAGVDGGVTMRVAKPPAKRRR